jgi:hypothetical protein
VSVSECVSECECKNCILLLGCIYPFVLTLLSMSLIIYLSIDLSIYYI